MAVYAIADLHLSTLDTTNKSMEVFGRRWEGYTEKLKKTWEKLVDDNDTVIIPGDISWALSLEEAKSDLSFIDTLPGKKILGKGNHDFWWSTMSKHRKFFEDLGISTISFLHNNAHEVEDFIIAGTRGWFYDEDTKAMPENADFEKIIAREAQRLTASLKEAKRIQGEDLSREIIAFMHFPPVFSDKATEKIIEVLHEYGIKRVYYGHIHGSYMLPPSFTYEGIEMNIISADYLNFTPKYIEKRN